ncbi:MAG TPA: hypothetical protein VF043_24650 [Ktedonobacteraceae bacterium]
MRKQACDGAREVWRSAQQTGVRYGSPASASLIFPIRHIALADAGFCPVEKACSTVVQAVTYSLSIPSFCPIVSSRVDTIVLFFL